MGRSGKGAFIGFLVALVGGIFLGYLMLEWARTIDHGEIVFFGVIIIIPILAILGAIIGWVLEPSEPKNMDEPTTKKKIDGECICILIILVITILFIMFGIDIPSWLSL